MIVAACRKLFSPFADAILRLVRSKPLRSGFTAAMAAGFFVHFFVFANYLVNHDSVTLPYNDADWLLSQGKWFATPLTSLEGSYVLSYLSYAIGLLAVAAAAGVLCEAFEVRSVWRARLIGALVVAFPSISAMISFMAFDYFGLAMLLAVLAGYFTMQRGLVNRLAGAALLTLSIGAYQAYLGFALAMLVLDCAVRLTKNEKPKQVILRGLGYIAFAIVCILAYYAILRMKLHATGTALSSYKGMNSVENNMAPRVILSSAINAYKDVLRFYLLDIMGLNGAHVYLPGFLLFALLGVSYGLQFKPDRKALVNVFMGWILLFAVLPLSVNIIGVLSANTSFYYNSVFPFVMIPLAPLLINTAAGEPSQKWLGIARRAAAGTLSLVLAVLC